MMTRASILEAAISATNGDRDIRHGKPEDSFTLIGQLWEAYTGRHYTAEEVAMMMVLLKVARVKMGVGDTDSYIDIAGYAACAGEISEKARAFMEVV